MKNQLRNQPPQPQPTYSIKLLEHLRSVTWHRHEAFEKLPFIKALMDGTLPLQSYIAQLRGLAIIFSALEHALTQSRTPTISKIQPLLNSRFSMLCKDLALFSSQLVPDNLPAVIQALGLAREIRTASDTTGKLLGFLYVLEGTIRGNQIHLPDIIKCFKLEGEAGTLFYRGYGDSTAQHWEEFSAIMNEVGNEVFEEATKGAVEIYDALERFHVALYPITEGNSGFTATALNPEAGDHPVPQNPEVLQAALRAGRRCHSEFTYYEHRFGERGRRFTDSDAAWLAALADQPASVVSEQVLWLGRVLSARGMPFLLMERQLEVLVEELGNLSFVVQTEGLKAVISELQQQRGQMVARELYENACNVMAGIVSSAQQKTAFPDLPVMLVAAQIDLLNGVPECLASLSTWLIESSILNEKELGSVTEVLANIGYSGKKL
jgi:heme oxygenase